MSPAMVWLRWLCNCTTDDERADVTVKRIEAATRAETASILLFLYARMGR